MTETNSGAMRRYWSPAQRAGWFIREAHSCKRAVEEIAKDGPLEFQEPKFVHFDHTRRLDEVNVGCTKV